MDKQKVEEIADALDGIGYDIVLLDEVNPEYSDGIKGTVKLTIQTKPRASASRA